MMKTNTSLKLALAPPSQSLPWAQERLVQKTRLLLTPSLTATCNWLKTKQTVK